MRIRTDHRSMHQRRSMPSTAIFRRMPQSRDTNPRSSFRPLPAAASPEIPPAAVRYSRPRFAAPPEPRSRSRCLRLIPAAGRRSRHAAFIASQNSPSLVAPSPVQTSVISSALPPAYVFPCAHPTACTNCVPVGDDPVTIRSAGEDQCDGICRPPELGSRAAPTACSSISSAVMPSV